MEAAPRFLPEFFFFFKSSPQLFGVTYLSSIRDKQEA